VTAHELKRILGAFVNDPSELDVRQGRIVAQIQDDLIDVRLLTKADSGELMIEDSGTTYTPRAWILRRVAKLDLLAERILAYVPGTTAFVVPSGLLRGDLASSTADQETRVSDVASCLEQRLGAPIPATTAILYLTSDAGEGKTTLINHLARQQADRCKSRTGSWLLVPIALGGKTFLRFDDVVIGTLSNRFRFNRYYFDGFLELVKLGAVVPAFDGFEEMFVEGHSGEAVSALGSFIDSLESAGSIMVAARKAFFEITSFKTQARLFDAIGDRSASFARLKINRWQKPQFLEYATLRGLSQAEDLYETFAGRLGVEHPMLSRAFLVKRLVDLAENAETVEQLANELGNTPQDYFFKFVETLVDREAQLKWLDKTGDAAQPLLTVAEHHQLLAAIAREMWQSSANALRLDVIDVIVDMFAEPMRRGPTFVRQIRERIRNHSLLTTDTARSSLLEFDHDEFRRFYLGEALGSALEDRSQADLLSIVSVDRLPSDTCDQALSHLARAGARRSDSISSVVDVARSSSPLSFARENCGALLIRLLSGDLEGATASAVDSVVFPLSALVGRRLSHVTFTQCRFEPTEIAGARFTEVSFNACEFERLDIAEDDMLNGATLVDCHVSALKRSGGESERNLYGPREITAALRESGAAIPAGKDSSDQVIAPEPDARIEAVEKFLRVFLRATQVNADTIRSKFGKQGPWFVDDIVPVLIRAKIVENVEYRGKGVQARYKLAVPMLAIQDALAASEGSFDAFLSALDGPASSS
jgi:transcriptional regulator with XRE-family HTH domain